MDLSFLKNLRTGLQPQEREAVRYGYRYKYVTAHPAEIIEGRALINRSKYRVSQTLPAKDNALYVVHESAAFDVYHDTPIIYDPAHWEVLKKPVPKWTDPESKFPRAEFVDRYNWDLFKVSKIKKANPFHKINREAKGLENSLAKFREVEFHFKISPKLKTAVYVGRRVWGIRTMMVVKGKRVFTPWVWEFY